MAELETGEEAAAWIDGLKVGDRDVVLKALDALRVYGEQKHFGSVTMVVVAGRFKQVKLEQSYQSGS